MKVKFQQKIFDAYKANHDAVVKHGKYQYAIAYNAICTIHTWIIRRGIDGKWHWHEPLNENVR